MSRFTPEQAEAVRRRSGSLLLAAAAGSGKTSVLVERFVRAVLDDGVAPTAILAITFTEKAAGELRARVRARFAELGAREAARETEGAWVSTVHGFCARVLRAHAVAAGLDPAFAVLDEPTARELRGAAWEQAFAAWLDGGGAKALDVAAAYGPDRLRDAVAAAHDALRSAGATRPALPVPPAPADAVTARAALAAAQREAAAELQSARDGTRVDAARAAVAAGETFSTYGMAALCGPGCTTYLEAAEALATAERDARAVAVVGALDALLGAYADAYADRKRARSALDFDDLELRARDLLRDRPALRRAYAERFALVMVDEFQDTNPLQLELVDLLDRDDVFVVGDERQSIYGFRHADVEVFRTRARELAERDAALALQTNFRTRADVLAAVNAVFGAPALRAGRPEPPDGEPRVELLLTDADGWEDVPLGALPSAPAWRQAEARLLAQRVRELVDAGRARPEDVVVLVRAMSSVPVFERALEDAGLPTLAVGGRGYWGRQVVRDLCGWLAALANPRDEVALLGVLASPLVGASTDALALLAEAGTGNAWRALDAAFLGSDGDAHGGGGGDGPVPGADLARRVGGDDRRRLAAFARRFAHERAGAPRFGLDELLERVVRATDYDLHVLSLPGGERRLANVHKLLRLAAEHEAEHGRDVRGLVDRATAELAADAREPDAPVELGGLKAVRLMTVHAAKGLEFPVVCVADLGRRLPADTPDLLVRDGDVGLRLVGLDGSSEPALAYARLRERALADAAEEEERVMYVALTRARERLVLSGSARLRGWPNGGPTRPAIAWLAPALAPGVERGPQEAEPPVREVALPGGALRLCVSTPATVGEVLTDPAPGAAAAGARPVAVPAGPAPPEADEHAAPPPPETLSYSALSAWRRCGYRFYLQRILRLPEERVPAEERRRDTAGALDLRLRGTLVHELLEQGAGEEGLAERVEAVAARHGVELTEAEAADVAALARAGARSPLAARLAAARAVRREHGFVFGLGPTTVTGVVDVLADEPEGALVVDWKTDRLAEDADVDAYLEEHYGVQRRIYALAVLRSGAPRVEVAYALLDRGPGAVHAATYGPADVPVLEAELLAVAEGPLTGDFRVADVPHRDLCLTCPGRRSLCSWDESMTLRDPPCAVATMGPER